MALEHGYKILFLEGTAENQPYAADVAHECDLAGIDYMVWDPDPTLDSVVTMPDAFHASGYVMQVESIRDWVGLTTTFREHWAELPAALVTTMWGVGVVEARWFTRLGFSWLTECYISENPQATPNNMDFAVRQAVAAALGVHVDAVPYGWSQPVLGLQDGKTLADYPEAPNFSGVSHWSAEYVFG